MFLLNFLSRGARHAAVALACWGGALTGLAQTAFDAFDTNLDGNVYAMVVQPDGRAIIGGGFSSFQPNRFGQSLPHSHIARLNPDGSSDESFQFHCDGDVTAIALQADGRIIIGGKFTRVWISGESIPTQPNRNGLARINTDGTLDPTFDPHPVVASGQDNQAFPIPLVRAIGVQPDGRIVVGGAFTGFQTGAGFVARERLARLHSDGSLDDTFTSGMDNVVQALAIQPDGAILVGGGFRNYRTTPTGTWTAASCLLRLLGTGAIDPSFTARANNRVLALHVCIDGRILVGGEFYQITTAAGATTRTFLARLAADGTVDTTFDPAPNGAIESLVVQADGKIVFGGRFTGINLNGQGLIARSHVVRVLSTGALDQGFVVNPNGTVAAMAVQADGALLIGGNFGTASSVSGGTVVRARIARIQPDGNVEALFAPATGRIRQVVPDGSGNLIVVGEFSSFGGVTRGNIARITPAGALDADFNPWFNGVITAVAVDASGRILVGGSFSTITEIAADGTEKVFTRTFIARLTADGKVDESFDPRANARVQSILVQTDGKILLGGGFTTFQRNGTETLIGRVYLARLLDNGAVDETFSCNADGAVHTLVKANDTSFYVGGEFNNVAPKDSKSSVFRRYLARINNDGTLDDKFDPRPNAVVEALVTQADGAVLVGGQFTGFFPAGATEGITRLGIARVSADGKVDPDFDPRPDGPVYGIAPLSNDLIAIGGSFVNLRPNGGDAVARRYMAFIDGKGKVLADHDVQANDIVWWALPLGVDRVLMAGQFNALFRPGSSFVTTDQQLTVLRADGAVDTGFVIGAETGAAGAVNAIVQEPDGQVLVGGDFDEVGGSVDANLMRLNYTGTPALGFSSKVDGAINAIYLRSPSLAASNDTGPVAWLTAAGRLRPLAEFTTAATALFNGTVEAVLRLSDGSFILGGTFSNVAGTTGGNLVKIKPDGTLDETFNPSPNGTVSALALDDSGRLLIGGQFTQIAGAARTNFARLTATNTLDALDLRLNKPVRTITKGTGNAFYVGGEFTTAAIGTGDVLARSSIVHVTATDQIDVSFAPVLSSSNDTTSVFSIVLQPGTTKMLVGGIFDTVAGAGGHTSIVRLDAASGAVDPTFTLQFDDLVETIVEDNGGYLVAGYFSNAAETASGGDTVSAQRLARFTIDSTGKAKFDPTFKPVVNGPVHQVGRDSQGRLLVVGGFSGLTALNGQNFTVRRLAARYEADGSIDDSFNPQPDGVVWGFSLQSDDSAVLVGAFNSILPEAEVLIGGSFAKVGSVDLPNLALLNADGSAAPFAAPAPDGTVHAIAGLPDGRILLGGAFTHLGTSTRGGLAVLDGSGVLDGAFTAGTDGAVRALSVQPDGRIVIGGTFANAGGAAHVNLARLSTDGTADATFNPSTNGDVATIVAQPDGKILVAGSFTTINGAAQPYLARLLASGALDTGFNPVLNGSVAAIALQSDGGMLIGGTFTSVSGTTRLRFARLTGTGAVDASVRFDIDAAVPDVNAASEVRAINVLPDGRAMVGGIFRNAGGRARFLVTRAPAAGVAGQTATVNAARTVITWLNAGSRAEFAAVNFALSNDGTNFTDLGAASRTGTLGTWQLAVPELPADELYYIRVQAVLPSSRNHSTGRYETSFQFYNDQLAGPYATGILGSGPSGGPGGGDGGGSSGGSGGGGGSSGGSGGGGSGGGGSSGGGGGGGSTGASLGEYHLMNFSVRARPNDGDKLIAGFVLQAGTAHQVVLRAIGPGLADYDVADPMPAPLLELFDNSQQPLGTTAAWQGDADLAQAFADVDAFALDPASADAAQAPTLAPGLYTIHVSPSDGTNGIALAEVYSGDAAGLANVSARGPAGSGDAVLIVGFVVGGDQARHFLIRGVGPGLATRGVADALVDPSTRVYDVDGELVAANDDWETQATGTAADITAAESTSGAFVLDAGSKDAALVLTLAPGVYTAHVSGTAPGTGLVEVYELP